MKLYLFFPYFALALLMAACDQRPSVVQREGEPDYYRVQDHAAMDAAIARAKADLATFRSALERPSPTQTYFSVKKPFPYRKDGEEHQEHIWIQDVKLTGNGFTGTVGNEPVDTRDVALGESVLVKDEDVSDWMIVDGGTLIGGFTIRVLRDSLSEQERNSFDQSVPFRIE